MTRSIPLSSLHAPCRRFGLYEFRLSAQIMQTRRCDPNLLCATLMTVPKGRLDEVINLYDWGLLRTSTGNASSIPERLCGLIFATQSDDVQRWYWLLENFIVVQGYVYDSALPSLHVLIVALNLNHISARAKLFIYELIYQIVNGYADNDPLHGNISIVDTCREFVGQHLKTLSERATPETDELLQSIKARTEGK